MSEKDIAIILIECAIKLLKGPEYTVNQTASTPANQEEIKFEDDKPKT